MVCMSQYKDVTVYKHLYFKGVDLNKTSASKEYKVCHYWFFKDIRSESEEHVSKGCHYMLTMDYSSENIANLGAKNGYRCILMGTSKNETLEKIQ